MSSCRCRWLCILELRLAALAEGINLGQEMACEGEAAEAEAKFSWHGMRSLWACHPQPVTL